MMIRNGTVNDTRFADVALTTYTSGPRLIVVINQACVARLVLTPFDFGAGSTGRLHAIAQHSLPLTVTLGEALETQEN